MSAPLTALLLSDGKPGHYHQAEGVVAAIARKRPVTTIRLDIGRRFLMPTRLLLDLVNRGASPAVVLRLGYGISAATLQPADVIVSAGGETLAANAAAARALGAANIFCGRLRRLDPDHVKLAIVSLERYGKLPNHLVTLPPSAIEPARARKFTTRLGLGNAPSRVGVLVGGDSGAHRYTEEDWRQLTQFLQDAHQAHGIRWLVATSRRSGAAISDALAALAVDGRSGLETFIDFRTAGPGTLAQIFAEADALLCTDDSTMMLSEAVSAGLPAVSVAPAHTRLEPREAEYRQFLVNQGWMQALPLTRLSPDSFLAALDRIVPRTGSHLDELAAAIGERLPQLFVDP